VIVEPNCLVNGLPNLVNIDEARGQAIFGLENAIHAFGQGIVITIALSAHTGETTVLVQVVPEAVIGELNAPITVMDQSRLSDRRWALLKGLAQGGQRTVSGQRGRDSVTNDVAGEGISDQGQLAEALFGVNIGNIADPGLMRGGQSRGRQQVLTPPVTGPGGAGLAALRLKEQALPGQEGKKAVTAHFIALCGQPGAQLVQQFTASHARMALPDQTHLFHNRLFYQHLPRIIRSRRRRQPTFRI